MLIHLRNLFTFKLAGVLLFAAIVSGCAQTTQFKHGSLNTGPIAGTKKVVVMPLDVELALLTASGLTEPKAEWTEKAIGYMTESLKKSVKTDNPLGFYKSAATDPKSSLIQLEKLHQATGYSILNYDMMMPLPSKKTGKHIRTLGPTAADLARETGADYGLFIFVRDTYTSGGRAALMFLAAAGGISVQGGTQVGFASLVDLKSGDIVWFNRMVSGTGDLRNQADADRTMTSLIKGFPLVTR
ncbi:MAG: hypothetical protein B0W54_17625 [Cellvibrio sp. 79]|nr:MAG: hypothetical protein B0W54_17625 [Cellvibrio sp. 79]